MTPEDAQEALDASLARTRYAAYLASLTPGEP